MSYDNRISDAFKTMGIKQAGPTPKVLLNLQGKTYTEVARESREIINARSNAIPNVVNNMLNQTNANIDQKITKYINVPSMNKHTQRVIEAWEGIKPGRHLSLDIENLGVRPGTTGGTNLFAVTEIGLSGWNMDGNKFKAINDSVWGRQSIVGNIGGQQKNDILRYISQLEKGTLPLNEDISRSLWWLTKYSNADAFAKQDIFGTTISTIDPNKILNRDIPLRSSDLRKYTAQMRAGLNNLVTYGNSPENLIKALNMYIGEVSKSGGSLIGYNILDHDIPALISYFEGLGVSNASELVDNMKSMVAKNKVVDVHTLVSTYKDPIGQIGPLIDKKNKVSGMRYRKLTKGHTKLENLAPAFGIKVKSHIAVEDTRATVEVLNALSGDLNKRLGLARAIRGGGERIDTLMSSNLVIRDGVLNKGSRLYSVGGTVSNGYDSIFRLIDGKPVFERAGGIYKNTEYSIVGLDKVKDLTPEHKYGSWVLTLFNEEEDLYHTIVRPETEAGLGIDDIRHTIHSNMIPLSSEEATGLSKDVTVGSAMKERAMRRYTSIFSTDSGGGFKAGKKYYKALDIVRSLGSAISEEEFKTGAVVNRLPDVFQGFTPTQIRNLYYMKDRLEAEEKIVRKFIDKIDVQNGSTYQKDLAMVSLRDTMEGRIASGVPNLKAPTAIMNADRTHRAIALEKLGTINMLSYEQTVRGVRNATRGGMFRSVIEELRTKGIISKTEANKFRAMGALQRGEKEGDSVIRYIADVLHTRGTMAYRAMTGEHMVAGTEEERRSINALVREFKSGVEIPHIDAFKDWGNVADTDIEEIISTAEQHGNVRGYVNKTDLAKSQEIMNVVKVHDAAVEQQWRSIASNQIIKPKSATVGLTELAQMYSAGDTAAMFMSGYNNNGLVMAIFSKKHADSIIQLPDKDILRDSRVVAMEIPLANQDMLLRSGSTLRINQMSLSVGKDIYAKTGFDGIISKYLYIANDVKEFIESGNIAKARKKVSGSLSSVLTELSGAGRMERDELMTTSKIKQLSKAALRQRAFVIEVEELSKHFLKKKFSDLNQEQQIAFKRNVPSYMKKLGIENVNIHTLKESQYSGGVVVSGEDVRKLIPFSEWSAAATMRMTQSLNVHPLHESVVSGIAGTKYAGMLNPLVMTQKALDVTGMATGEAPPWLTYKVGYMDDFQLQKIVEASGVDLPNMPTTYEARAIMNKEAAQLHKIRFVNEYLVDEVESWVKEGAVIPKGAYGSGKSVTVGTKMSESIIDSSGRVIAKGIVGGRADYNKVEGGTVLDVTRQENGKTLVRIARDIDTANGTKFITSTGEKFTVTLIDGQDWRKMFGDKLGEEMHLVMKTEANKHRAFGDLFKSQVSMVVAEVNKLSETGTIGAVQRASIEDEVARIFSKFFGGELRWADFGEHGRGLVTPEKYKSVSEDKISRLSFWRFNLLLGGVNKAVSNAGVTGWNIREKLNGNVAGVEFTLGYENIGRQPIEEWYKTSSFEKTPDRVIKRRGETRTIRGRYVDQGIVKITPREIDMFSIKGMDKTAEFYKNLIIEEAKEANPRLFNYQESYRTPNAFDKKGMPLRKTMPAMGEVQRYWRTLEGIVNGEPTADDVIFRMSGPSEFGANEVNIGSLRKLPEGTTKYPIREDYAGTYFDLKNAFVPDQVAQAGELTEQHVTKAMRQGGAWFELPYEVTTSKGITMDKVFLPVGAPRSIDVDGAERLGGGQAPKVETVQLNRLNAESARILRIIQDAATDREAGVINEDEVRKSLVRALDSFQDVVYTDINDPKRGLGRELYSAKLHGSGQFKVQVASPLEGFREGQIAISESRFSSMIRGIGGEAGSEVEDWLMKVAKGDEILPGFDRPGIPSIVGRYPTIATRSWEPTMLTVNNKTVGGADSFVAKIAVGDAIVWGADSDGDFVSALLPHLKNKTVEQIKTELVDSNTVLGEMANYMKEVQSSREYFGDIVTKAYNEKAGGSQAFTFGSWVKDVKDEMFSPARGELFIKSKGFSGGAMNMTVGELAKREALEARLGREVIGFYSNLGTSLRRVSLAYSLVDQNVFSRSDAAIIANLGERVEQGAISSKHFSIKDLLKETGGDSDKALEILNERVNATTMLREGLMEKDIEKFKKAASTLGALDINAQAVYDEAGNRTFKLSSELAGEGMDKINVKFKGNQLYSIEEYFGALERLERVSGNVGGDMWHQSIRWQMSKQPGNVVDMFNLIKGSASGEVPNWTLDQFRSFVFEDEAIERSRSRFKLRVENNEIIEEMWSENKALNKNLRVATQGLESLPSESITVGREAVEKILTGLGDSAVAKMGSIGWGAAGFAGLMMVSNMFSDPLPADKMPKDSEAPPIDGGGMIPTPSGAPPAPIGRVTPSNTGYENMQIQISARDVRGLSDTQIGELIQGQISGTMPVSVSMNSTRTDNTQRLDQAWLQSIINNAITKGQAF